MNQSIARILLALLCTTVVATGCAVSAEPEAEHDVGETTEAFGADACHKLLRRDVCEAASNCDWTPGYPDDGKHGSCEHGNNTPRVPLVY